MLLLLQVLLLVLLLQVLLLVLLLQVLLLVLLLVLQVLLVLPEAAPWFAGACVAGSLFHSLTYCDVLGVEC